MTACRISQLRIGGDENVTALLQRGRHMDGVCSGYVRRGGKCGCRIPTIVIQGHQRESTSFIEKVEEAVKRPFESMESPRTQRFSVHASIQLLANSSPFLCAGEPLFLPTRFPEVVREPPFARRSKW